MEEVVLKPKWSNFNVGNSTIISDFFDMEKISNNASSFSIDLLRDYYRNDRIAGSVLIEELALRGYSFLVNRESTFLPSNYDSKKIIRINPNLDDCFEKINFSIIGLNGIVQKFNIKSDLFFDYIPIEGFQTINKGISLNIIENEFSNAGFIVEEINSRTQMSIIDIISLSKLDKINNILREKNIITTSDFCDNIGELISSVPNLNKYDAKKMKLITKWFDICYRLKDFRGISIEDYFDFKDKNFMAYCSKKGYKNVVDLIDDHIIKRFKKRVNIYVEMFIVYLKAFYYENLDSEKANIEIKDIKNIGTENTVKILYDNNITKIKDLLRVNLYDIAGLGKGKIANIESVVFNLINDPNQVYNSKSFIQESLYNIKISDLFCESGPQNFLDYCDNNNYIYVRDLVNIDLLKILQNINGLGTKKINEIINKLEDSKYNTTSQIKLLNILFNDFINESNDLYSIVYERVINNKTLEELGAEKDLTRERIRQLESKGMRVVKSLSNILYDTILNKSDHVCIDEMYLDNIFDNNNKSKLMIKILKDREEFYYNSMINKLFVLSSCPECKMFFSELDLFLNGTSDDSKDIISEREFKKYVNGLITKYNFEEYISYKDCIKSIENSNYKFIGNILVKKGIYTHDIYLKILKEYYPDGMTFNEQNCENMKQKYFELTNELSDLSVRNLTAKLQRESEVILRGSNTYIHVDNVKIDNNLLEVIKKYINHLFEHEGLPSVYSDRIYNVFKAELNQYGVDNYIYIYGILRYYYPEEFDYNNFWITRNGKKELTRDLALIDYLKKDKNYNIGIPKEKIISLFGLSGPFLLNLTSNSSEIQECHNKENLIYYENYKLSDKLFERINNYIDENIDSQYGYISLRHLLSKYSIYLEEENIVDENTLGNALKKYLENYYIKDQYVCKEKTEACLDEYFFFELYLKEKGVITRKGFESFAEEKGIYANRVYDVLKSRFDDLYQINITDFTKEINISESVVSTIYSIIDNNMEGKSYLPLSELKKNGDLYKMPNINYSWNEYLLRSILKKNMSSNYKMIDIPGSVLFNEKGILIKKNVDVDNYIDFLVYVYREKKYYLSESVNQVFKELQSSGLVSDTLPNEFRKRIVDEYGRLMRC